MFGFVFCTCYFAGGGFCASIRQLEVHVFFGCFALGEYGYMSFRVWFC